VLDLTGKVAIVTGSTKGIGRAIAEVLRARGARVTISARNKVDVERVTAELARQASTNERCALGAPADVRKYEDCRRMVQQTADAFGRIDILVNNAAEQHEVEDPIELETEQLERTFRTNVFSFFHMTRACLQYLQAGGSIINTTSITAYRGHKTLIDYAATKGAIVGFTRSLSQALVDKGIRVNGVAPGPIWTPLIPASFDAKKVAEHGASSPMERAGQPNEVAPCYVFLASEEASYMTGQVLHPNGGSVLNT
jgi:NAD(P)-dependent dehydrogenase (short-subunit alcohol dehydrogenase family)